MTALYLIDRSALLWFTGYAEAAEGEPLFEDHDPHYAAGWCRYHGCENPYPSPERHDHE